MRKIGNKGVLYRLFGDVFGIALYFGFSHFYFACYKQYVKETATRFASGC
jgi:hypothetical protein